MFGVLGVRPLVPEVDRGLANSSIDIRKQISGNWGDSTAYLPQHILRDPSKHDVYPRKQPDRHPVKERRAQERRRVVNEQNELERRWLQAGLLTIGQVANMVAQEVHVQDIISILTGICPSGEDEIFCS